MLRRVKRPDPTAAAPAPPQLALGLPTAPAPEGATAVKDSGQPRWRDVAERLDRRLEAAVSSPTALPAVAVSHAPAAPRLSLGAHAPAPSPRKD